MCFIWVMFVSCVHPVTVLHDLLVLFEDATGDHMEGAYSRDGLFFGVLSWVVLC